MRKGCWGLAGVLGLLPRGSDGGTQAPQWPTQAQMSLVSSIQPDWTLPPLPAMLRIRHTKYEKSKYFFFAGGIKRSMQLLCVLYLKKQTPQS